ncbi:hypothetical protein B0H13DRAFT_2343839 [Mycena leptocephala]|nr:hypothetical protein B0H13DRAFT_2343839 [Mycena leptocephala]
MVLGVWHFACKSHIDVKRVYCRFGYGVSDKIARNALNFMTVASLNELRASVKDATERATTAFKGWIDREYARRLAMAWPKGTGERFLAG